MTGKPHMGTNIPNHVYRLFDGSLLETDIKAEDRESNTNFFVGGGIMFCANTYSLKYILREIWYITT